MTASDTGLHMASDRGIDKHGTDASGSAWKGLYRAGGLAALITVLFMPIQMVVFIVSPPPSTVIDFFTVFQSNRLLGLLDLDLLLIADNVLLILVFLALYVVLRRASESLAVVGTAFGLIGIAAYFASNTAFNMLSLSDQYAAATTDAQRSILLAAGQAMLATYTGTAFDLSYILGSIAGLLVSVAMLRSPIFGRTAAYLGILANVIGLGLFIPTIGIYLSLISVVPLWVWYILVGRSLLRLSRPI